MLRDGGKRICRLGREGGMNLKPEGGGSCRGRPFLYVDECLCGSTDIGLWNIYFIKRMKVEQCI